MCRDYPIYETVYSTTEKRDNREKKHNNLNTDRHKFTPPARQKQNPPTEEDERKKTKKEEGGRKRKEENNRSRRKGCKWRKKASPLDIYIYSRNSLFFSFQLFVLWKKLINKKIFLISFFFFKRQKS